MHIEKNPTEVIDSYLYALVKNKRYTKHDIIEALSFIANGKVEYKSGGKHPLEQLGTFNIQKELFKSMIKKCTVKENNGEKFPMHSLEYLILEKIDMEGTKNAFEQIMNDEEYLNRLAENYILDHFEFEDGDLFYSKMHEDMNTFMITKQCERILKIVDEIGREDSSIKEEESASIENSVDIEKENKSSLIEKQEDNSSNEKVFESDMEKLEYCLNYMQKRQNYKDKTLIDLLNAALHDNYKVFTREDGIRTLAEEVPKSVLENKKALLILKQMEENL